MTLAIVFSLRNVVIAVSLFRRRSGSNWSPMPRRGNADPAAVGKSLLLPPPVGAAASRRIGVAAAAGAVVVPSDGEEEDSWSEPDVTAARRRMGLTAGGIAAERKRASGVAAEQLDSSETDLEKREFSKKPRGKYFRGGGVRGAWAFAGGKIIVVGEISFASYA